MNSTRDFTSTSELNTENCLMIYVVHSPPSSYIWSSAAACLVNIVFAIAGTILNSVVLFAYWKSPKLRSKLLYFEIMILSSVDVLVTAIVQPLFLIKLMNEVLGVVKCWQGSTYYIALTLLSGLSFWIVFTMSIMRYLAIVHPIFHHTTVNKRTFLFACICACFIHITNITVPFCELSFSMISSLAVVFMCGTYSFTFFAIFRVLRKKLLRKANRGDEPDGQEKSKRAFLRELKMAKTLLAIVAMYIASLVPIGVVSVFQSPWDRHKEPSRGAVYALTWVSTLALMSSTLNCLAFFWTNRGLRKQGLKILTNCIRR